MFHLRCISHPTPIQIAIRVLVELGFVFSVVCSGFPHQNPNSAPPPTILLPTIPETSTIDLYHPYPRYTSLFPKRCHLQNHISDPCNKTAITFRSELETGQKYTFRKSAENSGSRCPPLCRVRRTFFCENRPGRLRYRAPKFLHPCV